MNNKKNVAHQNQGAVIEQLIESGSIVITTSARACFNTNVMDWRKRDELAAEIVKVDTKFVRPEHGNWFTLNAPVTEFGNNSGVKFADFIAPVVNSYNELNPENKPAAYGIVNVSVDFTKFGIEDEALGNGIGMVFVGDSGNPTDRFVAHIKNGRFYRPNNGSDQERVGYLRSIKDLTDNISCVFRDEGTLIIYMVKGFIEKQKDIWCPIVKVIKIPVSVRRNQQTGEFGSVNIGYVNTTEECYDSVVAAIVGNIQKVNPRTDHQFLRQIIVSLGEKPADYLFQSEPRFGGKTYGNKRRSDASYNNQNNDTNGAEPAVEDSTDASPEVQEESNDSEETCSIGDQISGKESSDAE